MSGRNRSQPRRSCRRESSQGSHGSQRRTRGQAQTHERSLLRHQHLSRRSCGRWLRRHQQSRPECQSAEKQPRSRRGRIGVSSWKPGGRAGWKLRPRDAGGRPTRQCGCDPCRGSGADVGATNDDVRRLSRMAANEPLPSEIGSVNPPRGTSDADPLVEPGGHDLDVVDVIERARVLQRLLVVQL